LAGRGIDTTKMKLFAFLIADFGIALAMLGDSPAKTARTIYGEPIVDLGYTLHRASVNVSFCPRHLKDTF
jgi:hypothetical protein